MPQQDDDIEMAGITSAPPRETSEPTATPSPNTHEPKTDDIYLVSFTSEDIGDPKNWSLGRKWAVTDVLSATGFNRIMVSTIMAPALSTIGRELNMNTTESAMSLSIYLLATVFGPLFIGPLSEIYGRKPVLHASNLWFLLWNIVCGFANTKEVLIAARFLAGFGASSIYALAGGVLTDVWRVEERGRSLGIYMLIPALGAAVGPIIGGFMAGRTTWRWMFWSTSIFQALMIAVSVTVFKETYPPVILHHRAAQLRKETNDHRYYTVHERMEKDRSEIDILGRCLVRPLQLLAFHPIVQVTAIISAFSYGVLYIFLSSFSELWITHYNASVESSGLHYIACALGEVAGSLFGGRLIDYLYKRKSSSNASVLQPESRIPLMLPGAVVTPIGLLLYGWTAQYRVVWIAVDIGMFIALFGMQITGMPLQAYVMDTYHEYTSSALAATQFLRSLTAFLFPLFAPSMYESLGYGWGNSAIAVVGLVFGICGPWILWTFGGRLRTKATSSC